MIPPVYRRFRMPVTDGVEMSRCSATSVGVTGTPSSLLSKMNRVAARAFSLGPHSF